MKEVLIVDDSSSMRGLVSSTLSQGGFKVTAAENGQEALTKAQSQKYSLVVTDVNMPVMDGLTLVAELRKLAPYKFIPILVLTTEVDPAKKSRAKQAGATGWLVKPFDPRKFLATVAKVLS
ncbi:MAG: response regulator [Myxococcota bacterium]